MVWSALPNRETKKPLVRIGSINIPVEIAATEETREKGLSGRPSLDKNKGMLFIFPKPNFHQFWMRDMNFPIDIIWIDNGRVIGITPDVSNNFDQKNPRTYSPSQPAQYILEVNAGFSTKNKIKIGDVIAFENI